MKTVVITGGVGSGKTYVSHMFHGLFDIPVFHTDTVAKYVMTKIESVREDLKRLMGEHIYLEDGSLNHKLMGDVIFRHDEVRKAVEAVVHPHVLEQFEKFKRLNGSHEYAMFECANFFEMMNVHTIPFEKVAIIGVTADPEARKERVRKRSGWSQEKIERVMEIQENQEDLLKKCDFVIVNDYDSHPGVPESISELRKKIEAVHWQIQNIIIESKSH